MRERIEHGGDAPAIFRALFEASHLAVTLRDPEDFHLVEGNLAAARIYGYATREELLRNGRPAFPSGETDAFFQLMSKAVREGSARDELTSYRIDGARFSMEARVSVIEVEGRRFLQTLLDDISDRKLAEQAARRRSEQDALVARISRSFVADDADEAVGVALELLSVFLGARRAAIGNCTDRTLSATPERE